MKGKVIVIRMRPGNMALHGSPIIASTHPNFKEGEKVNYSRMKAAILAGTEVTIMPPETGRKRD